MLSNGSETDRVSRPEIDCDILNLVLKYFVGWGIIYQYYKIMLIFDITRRIS
jgi:hypothetical protein